MATTRAKDPKIIAESQKIFGILKVSFLGLAILLLIIRVVSWRKEKVGEVEAAKQVVITQPASQRWQLCWEKKPEHTGRTAIRQLCLPALVESRSATHISITYSYSGGRGEMNGVSTDGYEYDGRWSDSTGWGKWHLKFVSPDTAFGWSDDEDKGEKIPNVLSKK